MPWDSYQTFLGVSAAAVSQTINRLEAHLGARLLQRTTPSMVLTESGAVYYEKVKRIASDLESAQSAITSAQTQLQGRLCIASTSAFGRVEKNSSSMQFRPKFNVSLDAVTQACRSARR